MPTLFLHEDFIQPEQSLALTLLLFVVDLMSFIVPNPEEQTKVQVLLSGNLFHSGVVSIAVILVY